RRRGHCLVVVVRKRPAQNNAGDGRPPAPPFSEKSLWRQQMLRRRQQVTYQIHLSHSMIYPGRAHKFPIAWKIKMSFAPQKGFGHLHFVTKDHCREIMSGCDMQFLICLLRFTISERDFKKQVIIMLYFEYEFNRTQNSILPLIMQVDPGPVFVKAYLSRSRLTGISLWKPLHIYPKGSQ
ncbi:Uncharacterized protein PODLI_1B022799, partial [Podarcis lilfordi]